MCADGGAEFVELRSEGGVQGERLLLERLSTDEARSRLTIPAAEAARVLITMTRGIVVMERVYQDTERLRGTAASLIDALLPPET